MGRLFCNMCSLYRSVSEKGRDLLLTAFFLSTLPIEQQLLCGFPLLFSNLARRRGEDKGTIRSSISCVHDGEGDCIIQRGGHNKREGIYSRERWDSLSFSISLSLWITRIDSKSRWVMTLPSPPLSPSPSPSPSCNMCLAPPPLYPSLFSQWNRPFPRAKIAH